MLEELNEVEDRLYKKKSQRDILLKQLNEGKRNQKMMEVAKIAEHEVHQMEHNINNNLNSQVSILEGKLIFMQYFYNIHAVIIM